MCISADLIAAAAAAGCGGPEKIIVLPRFFTSSFIALSGYTIKPPPVPNPFDMDMPINSFSWNGISFNI